MDIDPNWIRILRIVKLPTIFHWIQKRYSHFQAVANRQQVGIQPATGDIVVFNNGKDCFVVQPPIR